MKNAMTLVAMLVGSVAIAAGNFAGDIQPPKSNLGNQVNTLPPQKLAQADPPPQVVYPNTPDVVEETIQDIEDLQLNPEQVERLKQIYIERERQKAIPYVSPAKPITRSTFVSLDPGVNPPTVRLSRGQQTSIVFSDVSGQPWFIENVSLNRQLFSDGRQGAGNSGSGNAETQQPTNILTLEPLTPAAYGNVTVTLRGLSTPVIFVLTSAQQKVDMRVDAKVAGHNPDALDTVTVSSLPTIDSAMSYFLDGVPPKEARRLKVTGLDKIQAWVYRDNLYVRANATAQYPAYLSAARSTNGVSVYRYAELHKSITLTTGGQAITVFIE